MKTQNLFFRHDSDAHRQPQLLALRKRWGWKGYGLYWAILEILRESDGYVYLRNYEILAYLLRTNTETIRSIVEDFQLFALDETEGFFASESLNENMEMMEERMSKSAKSNKKRGNPNFQNGRANPYYSGSKEEKDNSETLFEIIPQKTEINTTLFEDNSPIIEKEKRKGKEKKITSSSVPSEEVCKNSVSTSAAPAKPRGGRKAQGEKANPPVDYDRILELYHQLCPDFPRVIKFTETRKQKIRIRFVEEMHGDWDLLETIFRKMQASKFMRGDNRKGWKATFDWIFENSKNWVKIAEGNYDSAEDLPTIVHPNSRRSDCLSPTSPAPISIAEGVETTAATPALPTLSLENINPLSLHNYAPTSIPLSASEAFHRQRDQQVLYGMAKAISEL